MLDLKPFQAARAALQSTVDDLAKAEAEQQRLDGLAQSLQSEHERHIQSGDIDDPETVKAVMEIGAKLLLAPAAVERNKTSFAGLRATMAEQCAPLCLEALKLLDGIKAGETQGIARVLSPRMARTGRHEEAAQTVFESSDIGASVHDMHGWMTQARYAALNEPAFFTAERGRQYLEKAQIVEELAANWQARTTAHRTN